MLEPILMAFMQINVKDKFESGQALCLSLVGVRQEWGILIYCRASSN